MFVLKQLRNSPYRFALWVGGDEIKVLIGSDTEQGVTHSNTFTHTHTHTFAHSSGDTNTHAGESKCSMSVYFR